MQDIKSPLFTRGRVVKKDALDNLHGFPRGLAELAFGGASDGILYGFTITYGGKGLCVSAGALKSQGEVVLVGGEALPFGHFDQLVSIKLAIGTKYSTEDFEVLPVQFIVDTRLVAQGQEWELGRFCLSEGAVLRSEYKGVRDFTTPHNTLDLIHVAYAGQDKATMSPRLMKRFGEELLHSGTLDPLDLTFGLLCMNSTLVQRDCILWYLANRLNEPWRELTNGEIYQRLVRATENRPARQGQKGPPGNRGPGII